MGLGCLDIPGRGCERLAAMCVMARRDVLERELEEHESPVLLAANYLRRRKRPFHACPADFLKFFQRHERQRWRRHERKIANFGFSTRAEIYKNTKYTTFTNI